MYLFFTQVPKLLIYFLLQRLSYKLHADRTLFGMSLVIIRFGKPDLPQANKLARHSVIPALSHSLRLLLAGKIALRLATCWQDKRKQLLGFMKKKKMMEVAWGWRYIAHFSFLLGKQRAELSKNPHASVTWITMQRVSWEMNLATNS